jgi:hypothetical protein
LSISARKKNSPSPYGKEEFFVVAFGYFSFFALKRKIPPAMSGDKINQIAASAISA